MSYSLDFRKHVFKIREKDNLSLTALSKRFGISLRSLSRWKNQIVPKQGRNKPATKLNMDALKIYVEQHSDSYQSELAEVFGVSQSCIHYALKRLNISYKKNSLSS